MNLKLRLVKNKKNNQFNFFLPKKKIPKNLLLDIQKKRSIKIKLLK